jgi:diguanylate cyclase (GGDEF)-like protein/PAS domain S-box-containing protein
VLSACPSWGPVLHIRIALYGAWMFALTVAFYMLPDWHLVLWSALALSSALAIVRGVLIHRPSHRGPWWLLAAAVTVFAAGDTTYNVLTTLLGQANPFPSPADVFYLAMYPIAAAGLVWLIRYRTGGRDRGSLLDALSLTTAVGLLSWIFLIDPYVRNTNLTLLEQATSIAYPLGDVLILATLARLVITTTRNPAVVLLGIGTAGLLASDVLYGLVQLGGSWQIGSSYDLGWVIFYISWGAAALHPSMAGLTVSTSRPPTEMSFRRIALLMAVSLVAPAVLLVDAVTDGVAHGPMIAMSSAVLFLLVLSRLSGVVHRHKEAVERERTLRSAGAVLVSAADADGVATSVRAAVAHLMPRGSRHVAVLVGAEQALGSPGGSLSGTSSLVPAHVLVGAAAAGVDGFATALVCPLVLDGRPTAGSPVGLLVVAADETVLATLRGAIEVLASLAALAVERVLLSQAVTERENEAYFRTLVQNAHDVILIADDDGRVRYASPSSESVLGPGPVVGRHLLQMIGEEDRHTAEQLLGRAGADRADPEPVDVGVLRTDGARISVEATSRDLRDDPTVRGVVLTLRDVTEQRKLQQELTHRAFHDALTGLPNRVLFRDRVDRALALCDRDGGVVGVLLIDLDDFKLVNDTLGHGVGDELLGAVAERLTGVLRPRDIAARLGGDEFAILVEGAAHAADVEDIAARVVDTLCGSVEVAGGLTISVSVGVTTAPGARGSAEMLSQADLALYAAKGAGKGRWCRYVPGLRLAAMGRLEVRTELEDAIAAGAFELRYQPIVALGRREMVGVEALVRWRHPRRGLVPPAEFVPVAEETGLILALGAWVLDRALADLAAWRREGASATQLTLSVNVSAYQIRAPGYYDTVVDALARSDVAATSLVLEITETALLGDDAHVSADLAALRDLGVRIAIDDFGTGYSSLDYLRLHSIDVLKVDRSFIDGIENSRRQAALIGAIVHLARALDVRVVAEGVETAAQRDSLLLAGCDLGQGYLFSEPVTADEVLCWLLAAGTGAARPALIPSRDIVPAGGDDRTVATAGSFAGTVTHPDGEGNP